MTIVWRDGTIFMRYSTAYFIDRFILTGMSYFNKVSTVPLRSCGEGRLEVKRWDLKKARVMGSGLLRICSRGIKETAISARTSQRT